MVEWREPPRKVWVDDRVVVRRSSIEGDGLFATDDVAAGTVVMRLAGRLVSSSELAELIATTEGDPAAPYVDTITVYDDAHLVIPPATMIHFGNHSCDPNVWHVGPYELATRRDLRAGEELTVDYGTTSGADGFVMTCNCGSAPCRGDLSSDDWRCATSKLGIEGTGRRRSSNASTASERDLPRATPRAPTTGARTAAVPS